MSEAFRQKVGWSLPCLKRGDFGVELLNKLFDHQQPHFKDDGAKRQVKSKQPAIDEGWLMQ